MPLTPRTEILANKTLVFAGKISIDELLHIALSRKDFQEGIGV